MPQRGQFITLEGGEGAGKSTLARALDDRLRAEGRRVLLTREPGGTAAAEAIRKLLLEPGRDWEWTPLTEALLFNAARVEHLERVIRPALQEGIWVICDRFADSTRAYQLAGAADIEVEVAALEQMVVGATSPDLTFVLDLAPSLGRERMMERGLTPDAFEVRGDTFHQRVREAFLEIAAEASERCVVLDASLSSQALCDLAEAAIAERFELSAS